MNAREMPPSTSGFSYAVDASTFDEVETTVAVEATPDQRATVADRLGLVAVDLLEASLSLRRTMGGVEVRVVGEMEATVVQNCVVTLNPMKTDIRLPVDWRFSETPQEDDEEVDPDSDDPPEPIVDGIIDLGEAMIQQLSLEIDPFPRTPGLAFEGYSSDSEEKAENGDGSPPSSTTNPFAVLRDLVNKPKDRA